MQWFRSVYINSPIASSKTVAAAASTTGHRADGTRQVAQGAADRAQVALMRPARTARPFASKRIASTTGPTGNDVQRGSLASRLRCQALAATTKTSARSVLPHGMRTITKYRFGAIEIQSSCVRRFAVIEL